MKQAFRNWFLCVTAIAALLSLTAATYAWFTSNQAVSTTRASARTAEESLELQISSDGSTFSNASPDIVQSRSESSLRFTAPVSLLYIQYSSDVYGVNGTVVPSLREASST